jgi:hypothetical protein
MCREICVTTNLKRFLNFGRKDARQVLPAGGGSLKTHMNP